MSKKPTRAPKGLKGGTLKKDDGEKIKWTGHLDTEATPSISDEELARAKTIFFQNDKDENGSIDRSELQWMLKELGQNPTDEMLDQMMVRRNSAQLRNSSSASPSPRRPRAQKQADGGAVGGDNDGRINMREFLRWYARGLKVKRDIAKEDVQDVFQAIAVPGAAAGRGVSRLPARADVDLEGAARRVPEGVLRTRGRHRRGARRPRLDDRRRQLRGALPQEGLRRPGTGLYVPIGL